MVKKEQTATKYDVEIAEIVQQFKDGEISLPEAMAIQAQMQAALDTLTLELRSQVSAWSAQLGGKQVESKTRTRRTDAEVEKERNSALLKLQEMGEAASSQLGLGDRSAQIIQGLQKLAYIAKVDPNSAPKDTKWKLTADGKKAAKAIG